MGHQYGDIRHGGLHALKHSLNAFLGDDQLTVLEVQRVEDRVQAHLGVNDGRSTRLRGGEIQLEEGLLEVVVGHRQTGALLSAAEEEGEELPEEGVFLGEIHGLGMGLEADAPKDVICVGEEIAALSLRGTAETKPYVVDARNAE